MSDHIGGIAILDRREGQHHLLCFGFRGNERARFIHIPVHAKGTTPVSQPSWEYEVVGDRLSVTPSVRCMSNDEELFHNAGAWSVQFKDAVVDSFEELRAANPGIKTNLDD